jgi:hypothetical protein
MIAPTVGRIVWYRPSINDIRYRQSLKDTAGMVVHEGQPLAAIVTYVWHDRLVNLTVWDHSGRTFARTSVFLCQDDDVVQLGAGHAEWMPYQKGQAAKTEAAESKAMLLGAEVRRSGQVEGGY